MPSCPNCGKEVQPENRFCPDCGSTLGPAASFPQSTPGGYPGIEIDMRRARTYTRYALLFQILYIFFYIYVISFGGFRVFHPPFGIVTFAVGTVLSIAVILGVLDYYLVYKNLLSSRNIPWARTPALFLGIPQLVVGGIIVGLLLILTHGTINDMIRKMGRP